MTTTYTATVAIIDPEGNVLLTAAQATDTLAGLIEWGQMTRDDIETPTEPLTVEKVYDFLTQAFSLHKIETLTIEPAPEGTPSTLDDLENFAIRRQEGYEPTEEEFEEKWWASELYFRHPCGDVPPPAALTYFSLTRRVNRAAPAAPTPCRSHVLLPRR